jgi:gamma-glutamyltranspeptidase/glutathione hydrolase
MRTAVLAFLVVAMALAQGGRSAAISPDAWPERDGYLGLEASAPRFPGLGPEQTLKPGKAMIAGVTNPFAVHAGMEMLKAGGSAADAALTTVLAQVALNAGAAVSYAGIFTAVYYDATSKKVYSLNASWNTPKNESDPRSIPPQGTPSGRTALVPGFMAGVQALHDRFGRHPFAELFEPSIWLAQKGYPLPPTISGWRRAYQTSIERLDDTRRIFQNEAGEYYSDGDIFQQRQLADTLKRVASDGAKYMYQGDWAHHFVDAVQREGGKITLEDMASYKALWTEPARATYHGFEVTSLGLPNLGGLQTLGGLKLAEVANVTKHGDYRYSADSLYSLIQIARLQTVLALTPGEELKKVFPGFDPSPESRLSADTTKRLLAILQKKNWYTNLLKNWYPDVPTGKPSPKHSSAVVAVDEQGNVAAILHSCNCIGWGTTGIFVDGVSIPDAATFQQDAIARAGPGVRLPETTNPVIVLKNGEPVLASSTIGSALHEVTLQNLINVLDLGMDPQHAANQADFQGPFLAMTLTGTQRQLTKEVLDPGFREKVVDGLKKLGQEIYEGRDGASQSGYWVGIQIDPKTRTLSGGASRRLNSFVEGY